MYVIKKFDTQAEALDYQMQLVLADDEGCVVEYPVLEGGQYTVLVGKAEDLDWQYEDDLNCEYNDFEDCNQIGGVAV